MPTQPSRGRVAIDLIKAAYEQGVVFTNAQAIRDYLVARRADILENCTPRMATDWDRQARYEHYRINKFATHPIRFFGYERTPSANGPKRRRTRITRMRELRTRIHHEILAAAASAAQFDATQIERDQVSELQIIGIVIDRVMSKADM